MYMCNINLFTKLGLKGVILLAQLYTYDMHVTLIITYMYSSDSVSTRSINV